VIIILKQLESELVFLKEHKVKAVIISTTAKQSTDFGILPRRMYGNMGISSFMINDIDSLKELLTFYDGIIDYFYIDVEMKQEINLYKIAERIVYKSKIISIKPNDTTLESLDLLLREKYTDNLIDKKILVIGSGNLASKIMLRLAERQADVYVLARTGYKLDKIMSAINTFLPKYTKSIEKLDNTREIYFDVIIGAISNEFNEVNTLKSVIDQQTFLVDVGINNFNSEFIHELLINGNELLRLDTRIALPYQMIKQSKYTELFFDKVVGIKEVEDVTIAAGGIIPDEGTVIVDQIEKPTQVVGVADGSGGLKLGETDTERYKIEKIRTYISKNI